MKKVFLLLATGSLAFVVGCSNGEAQEDEDDGGAFPVEIFGCKYNEGYGSSDVDAAAAKWNAWADGQGLSDYSAWILTKFYFSDNQDFDFLWLGASQTAQALGAAQDDWLATGGEIAAEFDRISTCNGHSNFATIQFKAPPEEPSDNVVLSFSDCNIEDDKNFADDVAPALTAWAEHRTGQGSQAGHWVLFPVYGGGGEEFDFKFVSGHRTYEAQGIDYDNYDPDKARELFSGLLECDSSRVYNAKNVRRAETDE